LALLRAVDPVEANPFSAVIVSDFNGVAIVTQDHTIFGATTTAAEVIVSVSLASKRAIVTCASVGPQTDGRSRSGVSGKRILASLNRDTSKECAPLKQRIPPRSLMTAQKVVDSPCRL